MSFSLKGHELLIAYVGFELTSWVKEHIALPFELIGSHNIYATLCKFQSIYYS